MKRTRGKQHRTRPSQRPTDAPGNNKPAAGTARGPIQRRELGTVISVWFVLAIVMSLLAKENLSAPGLYYDEAVFAGMAKDFLTGQVHGQHMPGHEVTVIFGRPFPLFVQAYLGALKSWMLMPAFQFFGHSVAVLRSSNLFWGLISLLFFMLGSLRWLGLRVALVGGSLLALDSTYFFLCVWDWGVAGPSFLCRCVSFYLAVLWWRRRQAPFAFLAAFSAGLGFFNKIDFAVLLIAVVVAGLVCIGRPLWASLRTSTATMAFAAGGFLLGAGAMLFKVPKILSNPNPRTPGEFGEKLHTMLALYDGSYFYRLMNVGGVFERMFSEPLSWLPIFGLGVVAAGLVCIAQKTRNTSERTRRQVGLFLLGAIVLVMLGVVLLPGAVRIHHAVLVYPLPQLIIAVAASTCLEGLSPTRSRRAVQATVWMALLGILASQVWAIHRTQELVRETGGRGRWSESFDAFCRENKDRTDLTIASLDWGFNEQLTFLTEGPKLAEPFWGFGQNAPSLPSEPRYLFVVHPPEYSVFPFSEHYLAEARARGSEAEIRAYLDRQNRPAFYTIQYRGH